MEKITKGHTLTQSPDIIKQNIETLKTLFPTIVKEGKIDFEELKALLDEDLETEDEYYRLTWAGKSMARREATKPSTATLRPCKEESKNWNFTKNIFIEGDNLEVLKLMQKSYANKIKMIYIDPPYNTGKDFVYKDNYSDNLSNYLDLTGQLDGAGRKLSTNTESDGRYHSNWLNMMYPRLLLARNLLSDDGVIFISIDDCEVSNLWKLCEEIFGEDGLITALKWKRKKQPSFLHGHVASIMEYIFVCSKNKSKLEKLSIEGRSDSNTRIDNASNSLSERVIKKGVRVKLPSKITKINSGAYQNKTMETEYLDDVIILNGITQNDFRARARFRNEQNTIDRFIDEGVFFITKNYGFRRDLLAEELEKRKSITDLLTDWGDNQESDGEINELFPEGKPFDYPKPIKLIYNLAKSIYSENSYVLDFFAGSGTTGHSIMKLNSEDGGSRKFICVQLPEQTEDGSETVKLDYKNIAEICKERIRRAGEKILNNKREELKQLKTKIEKKIIQDENQQEIDELEKTIETLDVGFKVFKLDSSNILAWDGDPDKLEQTLFNAARNIKENRTEYDILYEILLKHGLDLTLPIEQKEISGKSVFNIGGGALFICLADGITTSVADGIGEWKEELKPATCKVIFKDTGFTDVEKTNSMQILKRYGIEEVNTI
jgi:adenine-specific DNA-methyltransferase